MDRGGRLSFIMDIENLTDEELFEEYSTVLLEVEGRNLTGKFEGRMNNE